MDRESLNYDALVSSIYESALNPEGWNDTLSHLRAYLNASAMNLIGLQVRDYENPFLLSHNIPTDYGKEYQAFWREQDIWVKGAIDKGLAVGGATLMGNMLVERRALLKSEFYNDWLTDQDIGDVLSSNLWGNDPNTPRIALCFFRGVGQSSFQESDRLNLHNLTQHLERAFRIIYQLGYLERKSSLRETVFDQIDHAVLVLNVDRKIVQFNNAGARLLSKPGVIKIKHERIMSLGENSHPSLAEAFSIADRGRHSEIVFTLARVGEVRDTYRARIAPLKEASTWALPSPGGHYLLLIEKNHEIKKEALSAFCKLFGITPTEQQVLLGLMNDSTPEEVAESLNRSLTTIRTHIQHIRQKTAVRRITELVRMALAATRPL